MKLSHLLIIFLTKFLVWMNMDGLIILCSCISVKKLLMMFADLSSRIFLLIVVSRILFKMIRLLLSTKILLMILLLSVLVIASRVSNNMRSVCSLSLKRMRITSCISVLNLGVMPSLRKLLQRMIDVFDSVNNPRRWKYLPPPWIESILPEDMLANVFSKLFQLEKLDI